MALTDTAIRNAKPKAKTTHICFHANGKVVRRDVVASDPDYLGRWLSRYCSELVRVMLETGPLSTFLYHGLVERGVAVECIKTH